MKFLYIVPLKQGLKLIIATVAMIETKVFIHSSIKTRIETILSTWALFLSSLFLYIVPLKQGLKRMAVLSSRVYKVFLYIVPLKQGLKLWKH